MSAIRQAFLTSICWGEPNPLHALVADRLVKTQPRLTRDQQRGWSTNVTFRTYNALKNQGVLQ